MGLNSRNMSIYTGTILHHAEQTTLACERNVHIPIPSTAHVEKEHTPLTCQPAAEFNVDGVRDGAESQAYREDRR